ncbi:integrase [Vibrio nigripulchritudo]|uniref:integrase n=1 Tax=Vibrio nigripulchritudo TaxID=28173 RepID=UPI0003B20027|nr:integrase [Vibrio nigripulchritudo]CCN94631.1 putative Integrase family protein [Vibrio nigripulchritudo ENn2]
MIHDVLEEILAIDGAIKLQPYSVEKYQRLASIVLWQVHRNTGAKVSCFRDDSWLRNGEKESITFHNASDEFKYELKALTLGMLTHGAGEGMLPVKWGTTKRIIRCSKRFILWLQKQNIRSLHQLDTLPLLRLRHLLGKYLTDMNASKHIHIAQEIASARYWWRKYGIVNKVEVIALFDELLSPLIARKAALRQKHAVIPTRIMKLILKECEKQLDVAEVYFERWQSIQNTLTDRVPTMEPWNFKTSTFIDGLSTEEMEDLDELHPHFDTIRRYAFVLIIAYSGMRHSEVMALEDNSAFSRDGVFYLRSSLSKTTDGTQYLEWVVSEHAYRAVKLIGKMNAIYRYRAQELVRHHASSLPKKRVQDLQFGIKDNKLFRVKHTRQSAWFSNQAKATKNGFNNINTLFNIPVEEADIEQLEALGCNVQSISASSPKFRLPYQVGIPFNFTSHQFRHTFAWFIVANRLGDLDDIKYNFKHLENSMTLVYSHRGYDTMAELVRLTESFEAYLIEQAMTDMVSAAEQGHLAGRGGEKFVERLKLVLGDDFESGSSPHFANMQELLAYTAKHSSNFRGLSHGYCTKGTGCKVRNAADPSHCINCDSYIATPKHLPHWLVIKQRCEQQLSAFERFPTEMQPRFASFKGALTDNLHAANQIIAQLQIKIKEA